MIAQGECNSKGDGPNEPSPWLHSMRKVSEEKFQNPDVWKMKFSLKDPRYSHAGFISIEDGVTYVYHAI